MGVETCISMATEPSMIPTGDITQKGYEKKKAKITGPYLNRPPGNVRRERVDTDDLPNVVVLLSGAEPRDVRASSPAHYVRNTGTPTTGGYQPTAESSEAN